MRAGSPLRRAWWAAPITVLASTALAGCAPSSEPADVLNGSVASATASPHPAGATTTRPDDEDIDDMQIRLTFGDRVLTASMDDNESTRDFLAMLPLTLDLTDFHGTEKNADLPQRLSTADAPEGVDPDVGDIAYYAPWGNLAIFYRDFGYSAGLVKLGNIDTGAADLGAQSEDFTVTIERAD
jgi:hypothetical protein